MQKTNLHNEKLAPDIVYKMAMDAHATNESKWLGHISRKIACEKTNIQIFTQTGIQVLRRSDRQADAEDRTGRARTHEDACSPERAFSVRVVPLRLGRPLAPISLEKATFHCAEHPALR